MTPTQLIKIKGEFEEKFVRTTILGRDEGTIMFRDLLSGEVWQWIESKLEEVEANLFKGIDTCTDRKCKCRLKDGVCQDWACVCPTCQLLKSLKSNKLGGKE